MATPFPIIKRQENGQDIAYMSLVEQEQRNDGSSQIHVKKVDGSSESYQEGMFVHLQKLSTHIFLKKML